ncbi:MAG: alanine--tRNA ligase-related protein, partial [Clostridia bacterium]
SGENIFKLYDTFGFPVDLTRELTDEKNLLLDEKGFSDLMRNQRQKAREARASLRDFGWSDETAELIDKSLNTEFVGYDQFVCESEILAIIKDDELQSIINGGTATLVLSQTPFYSECGGQVGDTGIIQTKSGKFSVTNTKKIASGQIVHVGTVVDGEISLGAAHAEIDSCRRKAIMRNHSSIHLMQAALRKVLGTHVEQAGSYVDEKHARFDFTHFQALSKSEIRQVEDLVNDAILDGLPITTTEMSIMMQKKRRNDVVWRKIR